MRSRSHKTYVPWRFLGRDEHELLKALVSHPDIPKRATCVQWYNNIHVGRDSWACGGPGYTGPSSSVRPGSKPYQFTRSDLVLNNVFRGIKHSLLMTLIGNVASEQNNPCSRATQ